MNNLPRNGRYEIFTSNGLTYCFDDVDFAFIRTPPGMFEWIRSQDPDYWSPMWITPDSNTALYLKPELYLAWKLKYT